VLSVSDFGNQPSQSEAYGAFTEFVGPVISYSRIEADATLPPGCEVSGQVPRRSASSYRLKRRPAETLQLIRAI
jgi:hypothetical protein